MRLAGGVSLALLYSSVGLNAQQNPFALTNSSVKSAHIVYGVTTKGKPVPQSSVELGVREQEFAVRMNLLFELEGEKAELKMVIVETRDSVYKLSDGDGEVLANLRPFLIKEFEALDRAGKERVLANLKLAGGLAGDEILAFTGEKTGSQTVAGHKCDLYRQEKTATCVLSAAPGIPLTSTDAQGLTWVAKKVTLNGPIPPALATLPKGIRWKKRHDFENGDLALRLWQMKKDTDPQSAGPGAVAQFAVRFLASPQAAAELKQAGSGAAPAGEAAEEDSAGEDS